MPVVACPACHSKDLYEIENVCCEANDSSNGVIPLALYAHYGPSGEMGWMGEKNTRTAVSMAARVCGACGHTTLFTRDLERLKQFAAKGLIKKL